MIITENFSLAEFEKSEVAMAYSIDNSVPSALILTNIYYLCLNHLQPLRNRFGRCIITSGYRCEQLNYKVGGSITSSHLQGFAADFMFPGSDMVEVFDYIIKHFYFDECIMYYSNGSPLFIHLSVRPTFRLLRSVREK